jgi:two-component system, OmpR family, response regulator
MRLTIDPEGVRVLVVDDEDYITDLIAVGLRFVGFDVDTAVDGRDALAKIASTRPDLVVLDISMPGIDGIEVLQRIRRDGVSTPVVFLTARDAPADRVKGLHLGADDYITKPFSLEELLARIEAVLRRVAPDDRWQRKITVDDLTIDRDGRDVHRAGQRIEMARTEFNLLEFLMMNAGRVVSKQQILEYVWQYDFGGESTVVETYISYLRKKLDSLGPPMIHTMRGVGYVLRNPAEDSA